MNCHALPAGVVALLLCLLSARIVAAPAPPDKPVTLSGHKYCVFWVAFSPDGKLLASAGADHTVRLWDVAKGQKIATLEGHTEDVHAVAFSPDGKTLASASRDQTVRLWDVAARKQTAVLQQRRDHAKTLSFSPDGKSLAWGYYNEGVVVWDLEANKERTTVGTTSALREGSVAYGSNDQLRAVGGEPNGILNLLDVTSGKEALKFKAHESSVACVAFSSDGAVLATGGTDGLEETVKLWDAATGKPQATFKFEQRIVSVAFSPDGKTLATGTQNRRNENVTLRLIDTASGLEFAALKEHDQPIFCVQFSPDGRALASCSQDGTIVLRSVPARKDLPK